MKHEIAVITANIHGRKKFVMLGNKRDDGKVTMEYTDNADMATVFEDEDEALREIPTIHNPLDRDLGTATVVVDSMPSYSFTQGSFK